MEKEIWKDIEGYEGKYQVSSLGRILNYKQNRILKGCDNGTGYIRHTLPNKPKNLKYQYVHRLVAKTFIDNPQNKKEVNHINGIKSDNRVENLEWCTSSENSKHSYKTGLQKTSEKQREVISKKVIDTATGKVYKSVKEAAKQLNINYNSLRCQINGHNKKKTTLKKYVDNFQK